MLELRDVVKCYRAAEEEVRAVDRVSLRVAGGQMVAVQGPSGSGKTTLLLLIAALLRPDSGTVHFAEHEVSALSEDQASDYLMADVGFIYQSYRLMPRVSVVENAALKLLVAGVSMRQAKRQTIPWLERLGLGERLHYMPEQLSGGERQRVAIARALVGGPRLILADEPTGNLDSARSSATVTLLSELAHEHGAAVVLVTHDAEAAQLADSRYILRDGKLAEVQSSADLQVELQRFGSHPGG